jgi:hypothetical protein
MNHPSRRRQESKIPAKISIELIAEDLRVTRFDGVILNVANGWIADLRTQISVRAKYLFRPRWQAVIFFDTVANSVKDGG